MSLPFNSNASVSTGSASIDYSLHYVIYFWFCEYLIIFDWLSVLVSAVYFCVHINILEFFNGIQLSYLKKVWSFWILLLWFIRWVSVLSYSLLLRQGKALLSTLLSAPWSVNLTSQQALFQALCGHQVLFFNFIRDLG